jgi:hypothetical protein
MPEIQNPARHAVAAGSELFLAGSWNNQENSRTTALKQAIPDRNRVGESVAHFALSLGRHDPANGRQARLAHEATNGAASPLVRPSAISQKSKASVITPRRLGFIFRSKMYRLAWSGLSRGEVFDREQWVHCFAAVLNLAERGPVSINGRLGIVTLECPLFHRTRWLLGLSSDELPWGAHPER